VFEGRPEDVTEENLQARIRGALLMAIANKTGAVVLTTGNKSECAVGYCTLYGDMCGGLAVIADLFKMQVYELARWINRNGEVIPEASLTKPPSAELRPNQKDEDSLPPYAALDQVLEAYVGRRENRRHKPGRAFDRTSYRFDVLGDYGAFRDLQRHRLLTLEWQPLSPAHGYVTPDELGEAGALADWTRVMEESAALHDALVSAGLREAAPYAVAMAYRVRFYVEMNAREAMHMIELRTPPQGHPAYRRICQEMHRLIAGQAGHRAKGIGEHDDGEDREDE
jgi:hypothetical protein